jgi:hypothetical protein
LGHPLGCTGARQVATALAEAKREKKKIFVTSMCIGSGMVSLLSVFLSFFLLRSSLLLLSSFLFYAFSVAGSSDSSSIWESS